VLEHPLDLELDDFERKRGETYPIKAGERSLDSFEKIRMDPKRGNFVRICKDDFLRSDNKTRENRDK